MSGTYQSPPDHNEIRKIESEIAPTTNVDHSDSLTLHDVSEIGTHPLQNQDSKLNVEVHEIPGNNDIFELPSDVGYPIAL